MAQHSGRHFHARSYQAVGFHFADRENFFEIGDDGDECLFKHVAHKTVRRERGDELRDWDEPRLMQKTLFEWAIRLLCHPLAARAATRLSKLDVEWGAVSRAHSMGRPETRQGLLETIWDYVGPMTIDSRPLENISSGRDIVVMGTETDDGVYKIRFEGVRGWHFPREMTIGVAVEFAEQILSDAAFKKYLLGDCPAESIANKVSPPQVVEHPIHPTIAVITNKDEFWKSFGEKHLAKFEEMIDEVLSPLG